MSRFLTPLLFAVLCAARAAFAVPDDAAISALLERRLIEQNDGVALVIGVTEPTGNRIVAYGPAVAGGSPPADGTTVFEIGSITKVFTALLLADMVENGLLGLDDAVRTLLPASVNVPELDGKPITLRHLSMHASGLPRMPGNFAPADPLNPYADYTVELMYDYLNGHTLARSPGGETEYSNLGVGLLGHALSRKAGQDYEAVIRARILTPLGMDDTRIALSEDQRTRFAQGYSALLAPTPGWDIPAFAGAGALRSTATDMLRFLDAFLGRHPSELDPAIETMRSPSLPLGDSNTRIALGWLIQGDDTDAIFFHNGMTGGYSAFAGFRPETESGIVVLANTARPYTDVGLHLLNETYPLKSFRQAAVSDQSLFDSFAGRYQLFPNLVLEVFERDGTLFVQGTGQPEVPLSAASDRIYFNEAIGLEITFKDEAEDLVPGLSIVQGGATYDAPRVQ